MERDIPHAIVEDLERSSGVSSPSLDPARADFADAVLAGFGRKPRSLPCRFFYDASGSALFEGDGPRHVVRFCFAKGDAVLDEAVEQLAAFRQQLGA